MSTINSLLAGVSIYADNDAFVRDQFGRSQYLQVKPVHDELYQKAIDLKLASSLVVMRRRRPLPSLEAVFTVAVERPKWHPANVSPSRSALLIAPVTAFARNWVGLRQAVEQPAKVGALWHDDPALFFEPTPGTFMCRTACTGHEGEVLYLAYHKEQTWLAALLGASLRLIGQGEAAYRSLVPKPGAFAE
jgi:hypothetical protein